MVRYKVVVGYEYIVSAPNPEDASEKAWKKHERSNRKEVRISVEALNR